jgi:hypothetical protein
VVFVKVHCEVGLSCNIFVALVPELTRSSQIPMPI